MKKVITGIIIAAIALAALYFGLWVGMVGGAVQIIEGIKADPVSSKEIAFGALRFFIVPGISTVGAITLVSIIDMFSGD